MATQPQRTAEWSMWRTLCSRSTWSSKSVFLCSQFIYLVSGKATVCADGAQVIFGLALDAASTTEDTAIRIIVATPNTRFTASVYHATEASAVTAVANVGEDYALEVDSNKCYVDVGDTSTIAFRVVGLDSRDATGDKYGRVIFKVKSDYSQYDTAG